MTRILAIYNAKYFAIMVCFDEAMKANIYIYVTMQEMSIILGTQLEVYIIKYAQT